ncbi:L-fucose isomerase [Clostridium tertium]|jgi:L-fucose/D-arabinose isomerase|uniref:L-fucose isomerase n=1 Tax=Clostridium TaxID=1485 RepID=UPI0011583C35|nr:MULTISPECIES: L-fucose isomerase [Clostridium]MBS5305899.1 L-fucose isomerase [Clostridium sp.]MDB1920993.1 L-fucose isomerase [Clostridium tertium]MDB1925523.1 L-fucose isomerase [Clostridium tertium]MDB1928606.1 L-fucose isomerase [Clostridium tertium]MDB1943599.1 L-fucose isomerase [Clostridium tertium]
MMYPKIGIRPTIDGRWGGVRESLEEQTMGMAKAAAELISSQLKYPDGTPVQCVISETTIGGGAEAAKCAEQFSKENVCATLTVTPCWCYGSETFDMDPHTIKAVWGFNGTERPGAVYLAAVLAAHAQRGLPAFSIYGHDVQDMGDKSIPKDVSEKILKFAKCAVSVGLMKNKAYVNFGSVSMGIAGSFCDPVLFQKYLGMRPEWVDMTEIIRRITLGIYDKEEFEKALAWTKSHCKEGFDCNSGKNLPEIITKSKVVPADKDWEFVVKMTMVVRDIMYGNEKLKEMGWHEESLGRNAIAGGFQGQRMWTDWLPNGDFMEAIMASTFDWNGAKSPIAFATENDTLNGVAMLLGTLVSDKSPCFHDVRTYWSADACERVTGKKPQGAAAQGFIHLINSGATALDCTGASKNENGEGCMKSWWDMTESDINACTDATDWCRANYEYFRGGGFSSHFKTQAEMPITMLRVNIVEGVGPVIQIAEGQTVVLEDDVHNTLDVRTDRTWPTTWFVPRLTGEGGFKDVYSVMANWGANHGVTVYGHVGAELITLASMLRIPVSMHNVSHDRIFRPHSWAAFGTEMLEAADYKACSTYGPLYK